MTLERDFQIRKIEKNSNNEEVLVNYYPNTKSRVVTFQDGETLQDKLDNGSLGSKDLESKVNTHIKDGVVHITSSERSKWNSTEQNSKTYTDRKVSELVNGAPESLNTLKELADAMGQHNGAYEALLAKVNNKTDKGHKHVKADITDFPSFPTSLPANGGNADTVDGLHADVFVQGSTQSRTTDLGSGGANTITKSGFYRPGPTSTADNPLPEGNHSGIIHMSHPTGSVYDSQIAIPYTKGGKLYYRNRAGGGWGSWASVYSTGNKPTPSDIGASPSNHNHDSLYLKLSGGVLTNTEATVLTLKRNGSSANNNICFDGNGAKNYLGVSSGVLKYGASEDLSGNGSKIYHEGQKPTPAEIGAATANHGTHVSYGTTTTGLTQGASGTSGSSTSVSRADHTHALPAYPTLASLGAAPASGSFTIDKLANNVKMGGAGEFSLYEDNGTWWQKLGTRDDSDKKVKRFYFSERQGTGDYIELFGVDGEGDIFAKGRKVYHTGNKPTAADVGAAPTSHTHSYLPLTGGTLTGTLNGLDLMSRNSKNSGATVVLSFGADNIPRLRYGGSGTGSNLGFQIVGPSDVIKFKVDDNGEAYARGNQRVYHTAFKPTATDVGARPSNWVPSWNDVSGKPSTFAPIIGSESNQAAAGNHEHYSIRVSDIRGSAPSPTSLSDRTIRTFFNNHSTYGGGWKSGISIGGWTGEYQVWQLMSGSDVTTNEKLYYRVGKGTTWNPLRRVYHEGDKPTAADIEARPSNWVPSWNDITGKPSSFPPSSDSSNYMVRKTLNAENLNDIKTAGVYSQNANANTPNKNYPENLAGCLIVTEGAGTQQRYHVYDTSRVYTRAIYTGTTWTPWVKEYNTANKPTAADVGARPSSWVPSWNDVSGKPSTFAPSSHTHPYMSEGGTYHTLTLNNWIRTNGATGWYSETYGGGVYMTDTTWVRTYNGKAFYSASTIKGKVLESEGHIIAGNNASVILSGPTGNSGDVLFRYGGTNTGYIQSYTKSAIGRNAKWLEIVCYDENNTADPLINLTVDGANQMTVSGEIIPGQNGTRLLGNAAYRWKQLYCTASPNVSSDYHLKNNITYIGGEKFKAKKNYTPLDKNNLNIVENDCRSFIKNMKFATYYYNRHELENILGDENKRGEKVVTEKKQILVNSTEDDFTIGFVAQDLLEDKVGRSILTEDEDGTLAYNTGSFTTSIAIALQEEIKARDMEILELKTRLEEIEKKLLSL